MKYLKIYENFEGISFKEWMNNHRGSLFVLSLNIEKESLKDLNGIEKFTKLQYLNVNNNNLKNLKGIENLTYLEDIRCCYNELTNLKEFKNLKNLESIVFAYNKIKKLNDIVNLYNLKELYCAANKLENLSGIENLINLEVLSCGENKLKNLDEIENLPNLLKIYYDFTPWEYPLPTKIISKFNIVYNMKNIEHFKTYESQKALLTKHPERAKDLEIYGYNEKIKEEFADIIEGSEFGFFGLKN